MRRSFCFIPFALSSGLTWSVGCLFRVNSVCRLALPCVARGAFAGCAWRAAPFAPISANNARRVPSAPALRLHDVPGNVAFVMCVCACFVFSSSHNPCCAIRVVKIPCPLVLRRLSHACLCVAGRFVGLYGWKSGNI